MTDLHQARENISGSLQIVHQDITVFCG